MSHDAPDDLGVVTRDMIRRLRGGESIRPGEWKVYFVGGEHHTLWQIADTRAKTSFIELIDNETVEQLLNEIADTLLSDPDLNVRLALLRILVRTGSKRVIPYID